MSDDEEVWQRATVLWMLLKLDPPSESEDTPICNRMRLMGLETDARASAIDKWVYRIMAEVRHHSKPFTKTLVEATREP